MMKPNLIAAAEIDRLDTWAKYSAPMCGSCISSCCTLPVEVKIKDLIRIGIVDEFERGRHERRQHRLVTAVHDEVRHGTLRRRVAHREIEGLGATHVAADSRECGVERQDAEHQESGIRGQGSEAPAFPVAAHRAPLSRSKG